MENKNPEKVFLCNVLSLAGRNAEQLRFLEQLGFSDFKDPLYSEVFQGFCNILLSGQQLNPETIAKYFHRRVIFETFRRICLEMKVTRYVDCSTDIAMKLQSEVESLKMSSLDRRYKEAC